MRYLYTFIAALCSFGSAYAQVDFSGVSHPVINTTPESGTGLDAVYTLYETDGVSASYLPSGGSAADVKWYKFKEKGGGYAELVSGITNDGTRSTLPVVEANTGYYIEDGAKRYYFWVVDYSDFRFNLRSVSFPEEQDCGVATIAFDADCAPIRYYTVNGSPKTLSRDIEIIYNTLQWNEEQTGFQNVSASSMCDNIEELEVIPAPLCDTQFTIRGDRFQAQWGEPVEYVSDTYLTKSIEVRTTATQTERDNPNEQKGDESALGGSAPADIQFRSYCTDAVAFKEWQFSRDAEFREVLLRFNESDLDYSFRENGTFYVKFTASNEDASCTIDGDVYTITIGESRLECPNAFSPDSSEGVNDEWKVSYKSIVSFKCWIFDRYGTPIFSFDDPAVGWDGKYKGKYVRAGVYYYVIEAKGADGKEYNLKGDINILKSKQQ